MHQSTKLTLQDDPSVATPPPHPRRLRLGEELPVFCEKCGYVLHGLPTNRCDQCQLLHFRCPECGHTQPINTLRPAVQRWLGHLRAAGLVLWVLFKINFFVWLIFGWFVMGYEWSYTYRSQRQPPITTVAPTPAGANVRVVRPGPMRFIQEPRPIDFEAIFAFALFALPFGMTARMLLLRWRRSYAVGAILAALVVGAVICGAYFRQYERQIPLPPTDAGFTTLIILTAACIVFGAVMVFPIWAGFVRLFLPRRVALALLDWQTDRPRRMNTLDPTLPAPS